MFQQVQRVVYFHYHTDILVCHNREIHSDQDRFMPEQSIH